MASKERHGAEAVVERYVVAASLTGAIPVPASSAAIIAENAAMVAHIASIYGAQVTVSDLMTALGATAAINQIGRTLFIEGAKLLAWGASGGLAALALSGLGATTAGVQTYTLGCLAIAFCENGGQLPQSDALTIAAGAKSGYASFIATARQKASRTR